MSHELPTDRAIVTSAELARRVRAAGGGVTHAVGAEGSAAAIVARALIDDATRVVLVTPDAEAARRVASDLAFVLGRGGDAPPLVLATTELGPYSEVQPDRRATMARVATLHHLALGLPWRAVVVTAPALARRVVPPRVMAHAGLALRREGDLDPQAAAERLTSAGYLRVPVVEDPGTFALRGGLFDVWPTHAPEPVRIELYGDLIASIKSFDPDTQRTSAELDLVVVPPARDAVVDHDAEVRARLAVRDLCDAMDWPTSRSRQLVDDVATGKVFFGSDAFLPAFHDLVPIWQYLPADACWVVESPTDVLTALRAELGRALDGERALSGAPHYASAALFASEVELAGALSAPRTVALHRLGVLGTRAELPLDVLDVVPEDAPSLVLHGHDDLTREVKAARHERGKAQGLDPLLARLEAWREAGLAVTITARVATQAERLSALLGHRGVAVTLASRAEAGDRDAVRIEVGTLERGVVAPAEGFVWVTEEEIFGHRKHRAPERRKTARAVLEDLRALGVGDWVVHVDHGVGRYLGLERKVIGGAGVELIVVEYAGGDKLFLPVHRLNQIQKYAGAEGTSPRADRLGGSTFAKTRAKVERRVRQMADELLRLYAERAAVEKDPLPPADDEYATFEATFPFEETRDQATAISDVLRDLESRTVTDRLVCGDVGFGKTEVAIRAAFRCALAGRQVVLLCPTTVLAQQHFNNFSARLADYPITVRALSRFQTKAEVDDTLRGLKDGSVDVVVGTHRLLAKDVHFKRLGLLVVDEEQRFGVQHKERIKQLRKNVDALTLTATPIPRTLQMAVSGLRAMSLITTPPVDRRAIRTITARWDAQLVSEAVERELARGGQIFYVYNRVEGIYERAARLAELCPRARIVVAHGQMSEAALEQAMVGFVDGEFDILCATSIIESGIDIPRANTILIDRADLFGLSQLYQLRGRVGRASERAYCYLLVPPPAQMTEDARSRIEALERYTELGSGFQVATLDMEIRGAGDLLGAEQSGFAASVGFDLFCSMLEDATRELRGETVQHAVDPDLSFDVEALLPEDYVSEVGVRLSLYKRLAGAVDETEVAHIGSEMEDRFGTAPPEAVRLVELMRLKTELRRLMVLGVEATAKSCTLHLRDDTPLDPAKIGALVAQKKGVYRISPDGRLTRRADGAAPAAKPGRAAPAAPAPFADGIAHCDAMLAELESCLRVDA